MHLLASQSCPSSFVFWGTGGGRGDWLKWLLGYYRNMPEGYFNSVFRNMPEASVSYGKNGRRARCKTDFLYTLLLQLKPAKATTSYLPVTIKIWLSYISHWNSSLMDPLIGNKHHHLGILGGCICEVWTWLVLNLAFLTPGLNQKPKIKCY